jgi:transglutaminase-like putative cysteine protease
MILCATHRTLYCYSMPSIESHNEVRLMPLSDRAQTCLDFKLGVTPQCKVFSYEEPGGTVHYFGVRAAHPLLEILAEARVETHLENPFEGVNLIEPDWDFYERTATKQEHAEFLTESPYITLNAEVSEIATGVRKTSNDAVADFLLRLGHWIHESLTYDPDATHVHTKLHEVLVIRAGVCQDFAHLMIACCRSAGVPARYVSGYLYVGGVDGMRGEQATHAWIECAMPDGRWVSFDPTNDLLVNDRYVAVHTGRDYSDVTPTRGVYVGTPAKSLVVEVHVDRQDVCSSVS